MMPFLDTVRSTIARHHMLARGDTVVAAISGGADSMALLHALVALRGILGIDVHVAHLDHHLRPDSAGDRTFVCEAADAVGVPVTADVADVRALAAAQKRSIEDAARQARYDFFSLVAARVGATVVATAHTRSDQVETVLMRALDGAPWDLLRGIPAVRPVGAVRVIRPLLGVWRRQILDYLDKEGVRWREDPTNRDVAIRRNWVRHVWLPELARGRPALADIVGRIAGTVGEADHVLRTTAAHLYALTRVGAAQAIVLPLRTLGVYPRAVQRRLIRLALAEVAGTTAVPSRVVEEEALRLLSRRQPGEFGVGSYVVRRSYDALIVEPAPAAPPDETYALPVPGEVAATSFGVAISAEIVPPQEARTARPGEVFLDADAAGALLRIRPRRPGDRFRPLGMTGKKKVQDLLVDRKVPRWERARVPILVDAQDRILWVVGQRVAEVARVGETTTRAVRLRVRPVNAAGPEGPFA